MVTSRQVFRGVARTMRAIDREAKRSEQRRIAYEKAAQKLEALETAAEAAAQYASLIAELTGAHQVAFKPHDWLAISSREDLPPAVARSDRETAAQYALECYKPGWIAKTFGGSEKERSRLSRAVETARQKDLSNQQEEQAQIDAVNAETAFARRVVKLDKEALTSALNQVSGLGNLPFSVEAIDVIYAEDGRVVAWVDGLDVEDMPTQSVALLQSGKASVKAIPRTKVLELHRSNICSSAIRVAVEFLAALPIPDVQVVMLSDVLDPATGHIEPKPVLDVKVAAQAVGSLNLARVDAVALVERLGGAMRWTKRDGLQPVEVDAELASLAASA